MALIFKQIRHSLFILIFLFGVLVTTSAQETMAVGQVLNIVDKSPIDNVNVFFKNTSIGVKTNEEGFFMIRNAGKETTLVFSSVGFKRKEIKLKVGESVGMQVELHEENTILQEVFVIPGANPALELMRRARLMKAYNDLSSRPDFSSQRTEQNLILLSKINQRSINKRIYEQLSTGALTDKDSSLTVPLYMDENSYILTEKGRKIIAQNKFSSPDKAEQLLLKLMGEISYHLNFYDNAVTLFDKSLVSPLASTGNLYYQYYLADSLKIDSHKLYQVHFRSKNAKNLAFNGKMMLDSASLALVSIDVELPSQANLNFIHNLKISQNFKNASHNLWSFNAEQLTLNMTYELMADSLNAKPELFFKRSTVNTGLDSLVLANSNFAASDYATSDINDKLSALNETPILKTAKWLADVLITGNIPLGKFDLGKVQNLFRITDKEGFRITVPLHTNEHLWKNISLGGYLGYGFKNNTIKYSASSQFRLPIEKRNVLNMSYTNDYRRIDYDYNDFLLRENPLVSGDEDVVGTIFALRLARNLSERKELAATYSTEWNNDIESSLHFRSNEYVSGFLNPFTVNGIGLSGVSNKSVTFSTRFSFDERVYDDHLQRIYIANDKPIFYAILEAGAYKVGSTTGNYAKAIALIKQSVKFDIGQWNYSLEGGSVFGSVPYTLLETPRGSETAGYKRYEFTMLNYMEYAADKYLSMHNELMLNGLILNQVPLIKHLNLRELFSFKLFYGTLDSSHRAMLDMPISIRSMSVPYMELGAGVSNIFRFFTLQGVWRLTDLDHVSVSRFGLRASIRVSF